MNRYQQIAHRILPSAGSEWPLSEAGRANSIDHAATIIENELTAERNRCARIVEDAMVEYIRCSEVLEHLGSKIRTGS